MTSAFVPHARASAVPVRTVEPRPVAQASPSAGAVAAAATLGAFVPTVRRPAGPGSRLDQPLLGHANTRADATRAVPSALQPGPQPPACGAVPPAVERPRIWREELGPLAPFASDPAVTDLFVNGAQGLFIDRGHGAMREPSWHADEAEVLALATSLIARGGRHVDQATPCVDVRLADGARVHAVLPPVARNGTTLSVRVPRLGAPSLAALAEQGAFGHDDALGAWLAEQVRARTNLLISGAAGAGKTTLLAALLAEASASDRIVTIEDVAELRFEHPHHVSLEARQPNIEGAGEIGLARLVREALRMRPDRLVVGECRGAEVRELLSALNTGHAGGAGTLHANGLADVPARLEALGALAGMSEHALARQVVSAIGFVLHVARSEAGHVLTGVGAMHIEGGRLLIREVQPWEC